MQPYRPLVFDNRPPVAQFIDGNPLTDGIANFGAAILNAGPAAAQIRQQREQQDMANAWRQQQDDRQARQDQLAQLWHDQGMQRQTRQDELAAAGLDRQNRLTDAQIANMKADNARQTMEMWGTGINEGAKRLIDVWKQMSGGGAGHKGGQAPAMSPTELKDRQMMADRELDAHGITIYEDDGMGGKSVRKIAPGKKWDDLHAIYQKWGLPVPSMEKPPVAPVTPAPEQAPVTNPMLRQMFGQGQPKRQKLMSDVLKAGLDPRNPPPGVEIIDDMNGAY